MEDGTVYGVKGETRRRFISDDHAEDGLLTVCSKTECELARPQASLLVREVLCVVHEQEVGTGHYKEQCNTDPHLRARGG